ncbi:MAG: CBS domain-containing protein [Treponema sp.]|nr:CBS domain-containing protein [Treponema sp.]
MLVKDVMKKNPVTVSPDTPVPEAKSIMTRQRINKLPVIDKNGAVVGILTRNDLIKASPSDATTLDMFELSYLLSRLTVERAMQKNVKTVSENETVEEAARLMEDYGIGCLPVMRGELLVGIITESDLFRTFIDFFSTHEPGARATFVLDEKPGQLTGICKALADFNSNIVSIVTILTTDAAHRRVTVKASGISKEQFAKIIESCGAQLEDIRNV